MASDPYAVLGLPRGASKAEVNRAFRKLAKEHHPDLNQGNKDAEEYFKKITAAYDQLTGKAPAPVELAPPAGYDYDYVAELESRYRKQRPPTKKPDGVLGSISSFIKNKFRPD